VAICSSCGRESPEEFGFCPGCGAPLAPAVAARDVRKVVTVLFCDLTGSTALGDRTDPEALRALMRRYYDAARAVLERHGGTVEKFVGDAVMAVFGVPTASEDDALRAVRAAVELRDEVHALSLEARLGVNTGHVVAGEGGTLVTGDAVNVAARLEQAAAPGEVLLGIETYRLVRDAVVTEPIEVVAKGKPEPLAAHRLTALDRSASGLARRLETPMVGRARERERLAADFADVVATGSTRLFTLIGPAGVGKSRLVADFLERVGESAGVAQGRALSYGDGITYWPLVEVIVQLGLDPDAAIRSSPGDTQLATRALFEQLAEERPLVLVFDDLHWAEPPFLDLVEHVADWSRAAPIFLLGIARPELLDVRPDWAGGKLNATSMLLEPLPEDDARLLAERLLGDLDLEPGARGRILETADGNPLFIEELAVLAREQGEAQALPATIQAVLQARLDRLSESERVVIERGAVEGQVFHRGAVTALAPDRHRDAVPTQLLSLVRKELVRPDRAQIAGDDAFRFRHLLIRDTAYEALPKATRADLHERFADWLGGNAKRLDEDEIAGYHLEQAWRCRVDLDPDDPRVGELAARAAARLGAAGRTAFGRDELHGARNLLTRAVAVLVDGPARRQLIPDLVDALGEAGDIETAGGLIAELDERGDERDQAVARALRARWDPHSALTEAVADLEAAKEVTLAKGDALGAARCERALGCVHWSRCRAREAHRAFRRALVLLRQSSIAPLRTELISWGRVTAFLTDMTAEELEEVINDLYRDAAEAGPLRLASARPARARLAFLTGSMELDELKALIDAEVELLNQTGAWEGSSWAEYQLVLATAVVGDHDAVERAHRENVVRLESQSGSPYLANALADWAVALCRIGEVGSARRAVDRARAIVHEDDIDDRIGLEIAEASVQAAVGDRDAALASLDRAREWAGGIDMSLSTDKLDFEEASVRARLGDPDRARELLVDLVRRTEARGLSRQSEHYRLALAALG
jgi:class 3 adenylate cyclase/tetratricopeptide (TPR) repeat protein